MIRADYSGLNWKKLGWPVGLTHRACGGQVSYSPTHKALFCTSCGNWICLGPKGKRQKNDMKPQTAMIALNLLAKNPA